MANSGLSVSGHGQVVVLLHSSLSSSKQWQLLVELLAPQFTCINIDLLSYGSAPLANNNEAFSLHDETSRIKNILAEVAPNEPYHIVGHSYGGATGLCLANEQPEKVLSLSLYEPVCFHLLAENKMDAYSQVQDFAKQLKNLPNVNSAQTFVDFWNGVGFYHRLPEKIQQLMAKGMDKVHLDFLGLLKADYQLADVYDLSIPTLLMYGENTQPIAKTLMGELSKALSIKEEVTINGDHMTPVSQPEKVSSEIKAFLFNQSL